MATAVVRPPLPASCAEESTMSPDDRPESASAGTIIAIVAVVVLLLLGGLVVLGLGAVFFVRSEVRHVQVAEMAAERATFEEQRAAAELAARQAAVVATEAETVSGAAREIRIMLDQQGKLVTEEKSLDLDGLRAMLREARQDGRVRLEVRIEVDPRCEFQHVAAVQAVCQDAGVAKIDLHKIE